MFDKLFDGSSAPLWTHIHPVNDTSAHITDGSKCWCDPTVDEEDFLIIHHSHDQRETYETGRKPQ